MISNIAFIDTPGLTILRDAHLDLEVGILALFQDRKHANTIRDLLWIPRCAPSATAFLKIGQLVSTTVSYLSPYLCVIVKLNILIL
jgi:hypothetical protein